MSSVMCNLLGLAEFLAQVWVGGHLLGQGQFIRGYTTEANDTHS